MSTTGRSFVVGNHYYCHQCDAIVTISLSSSSPDLICPNCSGDFLEECDPPSPNPPIPPPRPLRRSASSSASDWNLFHDNEAFNTADLTAALFDLVGGLQSRPPASGDVQPEEFNPMVFLQNYLNTMRTGAAAAAGGGGGNIQFVIENNGGGGGRIGESGFPFQLPGNLGDYFVGPGLEQLIQQLAENDPNRYGTPPASKEAVQKLPDVMITDELLASDNAQCAVCMDTFEIGGKAKQMPCNHIYHADCILPWLELHNSCPVCRYELPTDDQDYERKGVAGGRVAGTGSSVTSSSTGGNGGSTEESSRTDDERRFRSVQLPWPFGSFGYGSYGSNSGNSNNDDEHSGRSHQ